MNAEFLRHKAVPVLRGNSSEAVMHAAQLLVECGFTTLEVTLTTPGANEVIAALSSAQGVTVGAGTVLSAAQLEVALTAGAKFAVSPGLEPSLLEAAKGSSVPFIPGVFTPSEVMHAINNGFKVLKLFPGELGGVAHLKSLRAPFPNASFMPTGGVNAENLGAWVNAGAIAVGIGSSLIGDGQAGGIRTRARGLRAALEAVGWSA